MVRRIRWTALLMSALIGATGMGLSGPAAGAAEPPPTSDLRTVVYDSAGKPLSGATVVVAALPTRGRQGNLVFEKLGIGRTASDGSVSIAVDTSNLNRFLEADGSVDLRVSSQNSDGTESMAFSHTVSVSQSSARTGALSAAATTAGADLGSVALNLTEGASSPLAARQSAAKTPSAVTAAAIPFGACRTSGGEEFESLSPTSYYSSRWLPVTRVETRSNASMTYAWNTSTNTKWTVAYNGTYGGKASSVNQTTSAGYSAPFGNSQNRYIEVHWQYRTYDVQCWNPELGKFTRDTGKDEIRPWKWAGGAQGGTALTSTQFTCNGSNQTALGSNVSLWVARDTSAEWSNGVTLAGVSLKQTQTNSSSHKLTVKADSGVTAKICGSNAYPVDAAKVKEVS